MSQLELKNPENLNGWQFATPEELVGALQSVAAEGFLGSVKCYYSQETLTWLMTIRVPGKDDVLVYLTPAADPNMATWLVYDGKTPKAYTQAEFDERYTVVQ